MANEHLALAEQVIKFEEGLSLVPYYCTEGYPTIGYGEKIGDKHEVLPELKWTTTQAQTALYTKLNSLATELSKGKTKAAWDSLSKDIDRRAIMLSMAYQLGDGGLEGFVNTLKGIAEGKWDTASKEMLSSLAARQTPKRWKRQAEAMFTGNVSKTYKF